ncbi:MAG: hypothetical protein PVG39_22165 [Desulfobacteraceae bacterium]|jgi:hypothetical protein
MHTINEQYNIQYKNIKGTLSKCSLTDIDCPIKDTPETLKKIPINIENAAKSLPVSDYMPSAMFGTIVAIYKIKFKKRRKDHGNN